MSWSVSAIGKPRAVAAVIDKQISSGKCAEPEESIKKFVGALIGTALSSMDEHAAVRVVASGSQSQDKGHTSHNLQLTIEPQWGFVE